MSNHDDITLGPTKEGERLLRAWVEANEHRERARRDATRADCEADNAATALAKWMLPDDAKPGEKVLMWCGRDLVEASTDGSRVTVRIRRSLPKEGK